MPETKSRKQPKVDRFRIDSIIPYKKPPLPTHSGNFIVVWRYRIDTTKPDSQMPDDDILKLKAIAKAKHKFPVKYHEYLDLENPIIETVSAPNGDFKVLYISIDDKLVPWCNSNGGNVLTDLNIVDAA